MTMKRNANTAQMSADGNVQVYYNSVIKSSTLLLTKRESRRVRMRVIYTNADSFLHRANNANEIQCKRTRRRERHNNTELRRCVCTCMFRLACAFSCVSTCSSMCVCMCAYACLARIFLKNLHLVVHVLAV